MFYISKLKTYKIKQNSNFKCNLINLLHPNFLYLILFYLSIRKVGLQIDSGQIISQTHSDDLLFRYLETSMAIMSTCLSATAPSSAGIRKLSRRPRDLACRGRSGGGSARRPSGRRKQLTMSALALLSLWWTKSWTFTSWRWTRGCRWNILSLKWLQVLIW